MRANLTRVMAAAALGLAATAVGLAEPAVAGAREPKCVVHVTLRPSKVAIAPTNDGVSARLTVVDCPYTFVIMATAGTDGDVLPVSLSYTNDHLDDGASGSTPFWDPPGTYSVTDIEDESSTRTATRSRSTSHRTR